MKRFVEGEDRLQAALLPHCLIWGFSCQVVIFGLLAVLCSERKSRSSSVACDQVRGARGRGQGTETVAKLGGVPLSNACVSQRLEA